MAVDGGQARSRNQWRNRWDGIVLQDLDHSVILQALEPYERELAGLLVSQAINLMGAKKLVIPRRVGMLWIHKLFYEIEREEYLEIECEVPIVGHYNFAKSNVSLRLTFIRLQGIRNLWEVKGRVRSYGAEVFGGQSAEGVKGDVELHFSTVIGYSMLSYLAGAKVSVNTVIGAYNVKCSNTTTFGIENLRSMGYCIYGNTSTATVRVTRAQLGESDFSHNSEGFLAIVDSATFGGLELFRGNELGACFLIKYLNHTIPDMYAAWFTALWRGEIFIGEYECDRYLFGDSEARDRVPINGVVRIKNVKMPPGQEYRSQQQVIVENINGQPLRDAQGNAITPEPMRPEEIAAVNFVPDESESAASRSYVRGELRAFAEMDWVEYRRKMLKRR